MQFQNLQLDEASIIIRLMRDESVDGTLSPVSIKGTSEDETDNTTARRKVIFIRTKAILTRHFGYYVECL